VQPHWILVDPAALILGQTPAAARAVVLEGCPRRGAAGRAGGSRLVIGDTSNIGRADLRFARAGTVVDDVGELAP
jgi:hypothetical protein